MVKTTEVSELAAHLDFWIREVAAGHEVVVTRDQLPVAKFVAADDASKVPPAPIHFGRFEDSEVLVQNVSQAELAEEMLARS